MSTTSFTPEELKALDEKYSLPRMICLPLGVIGLCSLAYAWPVDHWAVQLAWTLVTAYALFCWTSCFHECAHQTLSNSKMFSIWLGRILGTAMFVPYSIYRESHIRHHAYLNKPYDWELWPYSDPKTSLTFRRVFVWIDLVFGVFMSPYIYCRLYFHKDSPLTNPALRRTIRNEFIGIVLFWGTLATIFTVTNTWLEFLKVWGIPHFLAGVFQTGRKFTEHLGMASYDPMLGTRTVHGGGWLTKWTTFANFDIFIHGPHHRHPRVAHNLLGQKMEEYVESNPNVSLPVYPTYFSAIKSMLPSIWKTPGVGMNAGAEAPKGEKVRNVENFVADVTDEVLSEQDALITK